MVSQSQSLEDNRRGHQLPIRGRHNNGLSRQPAIGGLESILHGILKKDLAPYLEPVLRKVVRQEVERIFKEYLFPRATPCLGGTSGAKSLELRFMNDPLETIFTNFNLTSEDEERPLQIALFDVRSQSIVTNGPFSSAKVEIFALDGDFCSKRCEDWTEEEFNANILTPRKNKGPLLNGDTIIALKNGVGWINKIKFSDGSSWRRSGKFILGVKVLQQTQPAGASIKEGVSKAFRVKDNRGELYKKHHPPHLDDDLWRLEKIAKNGVICQRLHDRGIKTVRDLVRSYNTDPSSLLEKVGRINKKSWEAITEHAKECVIDDYNLYMYHTAEQPAVGLLFDSIYNLKGVTFDGLNYFSPDTLAPADKCLVERVKQHAYKNLHDLKSVSDQTCINNFQRQLTYPHAGQTSGADQGQIETWARPDQPSTSYAVDGMQNAQIYDTPFPDLAPILQNNSAEDEFLFTGMQFEGGGFAPWTQNEDPQIQFTNWGEENGLYFNSHGGAELGRSEKPKAVWYKIRTTLKWVISVRRDAAAKRMAKLLYYNH